MNMEEEVIEAINNLAIQIRLLREDLRPELKKAEIFRKKKAQAKRITEDAQSYVPKRHR